MAELFKKTKKGKKASKKDAAPVVAAPVKPWRRVGRGLPIEHTDIDEAEVTADLERRTAAKQAKNYAKADDIAKKLQGKSIAYDDATHEWYVKKAKEVQPANNKRKFEDDEVAAPAPAAAAADDDEDDAQSSDDDDSEEDRLDDAFVARMQAKLVKAGGAKDAAGDAGSSAPKQKKKKKKAKKE